MTACKKCTKSKVLCEGEKDLATQCAKKICVYCAYECDVCLKTFCTECLQKNANCSHYTLCLTCVVSNCKFCEANETELQTHWDEFVDELDDYWENREKKNYVRKLLTPMTESCSACENGILDARGCEFRKLLREEATARGQFKLYHGIDNVPDSKQDADVSSDDLAATVFLTQAVNLDEAMHTAAEASKAVEFVKQKQLDEAMQMRKKIANLLADATSKFGCIATYTMLQDPLRVCKVGSLAELQKWPKNRMHELTTYQMSARETDALDVILFRK
jgi:hypothetical protein